jgi:hypothetical protein
MASTAPLSPSAPSPAPRESMNVTLYPKESLECHIHWFRSLPLQPARDRYAWNVPLGREWEASPRPGRGPSLLRPAAGRRSGSAARRIVNTGVVNTGVCDSVVCVAQVDRFSVTMRPELGEGVRQAAARQGISVSAWLSEAAADRLRNELLGAALDAWESEDGPFTEAELATAASRLGLAPRSDVA